MYFASGRATGIFPCIRAYDPVQTTFPKSSARHTTNRDRSMRALSRTGEKGQLQRARCRLSMRGSGMPMTDRHFHSSALPESRESRRRRVFCDRAWLFRGVTGRRRRREGRNGPFRGFKTDGKRQLERGLSVTPSRPSRVATITTGESWISSRPTSARHRRHSYRRASMGLRAAAWRRDRRTLRRRRRSRARGASSKARRRCSIRRSVRREGRFHSRRRPR